jgi:carboxymethylenebutenolidase
MKCRCSLQRISKNTRIIMGERIKLTASDGFSLNAYRAVPEGKARGGVVVIQEVWGLNNFVRGVVDRFARHGYLAVAPAMFDRVDYGYESDNYGPDQFQVIGELMKKFSHETAVLDVDAAIKAAAEGGRWGSPAIASVGPRPGALRRGGRG